MPGLPGAGPVLRFGFAGLILVYLQVRAADVRNFARVVPGISCRGGFQAPGIYLRVLSILFNSSPFIRNFSPYTLASSFPSQFIIPPGFFYSSLVRVRMGKERSGAGAGRCKRCGRKSYLQESILRIAFGGGRTLRKGKSKDNSKGKSRA